MVVFLIAKALLAFSSSPILVAVASSFFLWILLYNFLCIVNKRCSFEWNCRMVTVCHGLLSVIMCLYCAFLVGPWPFDVLGEKNTPLQTLCIVVTVGYFLFDFSWCVYMRTEGIDMLLHHVTSICGLVLSLYLERSGAEMIATIFGSEVSNPSLQVRWFLRETRNYETRLAKLNDIIFILLFLCIRIGLGARLLVCTMASSKPRALVKLGGVALYSLSVVWMVLILRFAKRRFFGKKRKD